MTIEPLNKGIYNKAVALGIEKIVLNFSGGDDEGYLNVRLYPWKNNSDLWCHWHTQAHSDLNAEVENWAWEVYSYSGAGDGCDYGDDITYDLVNKKVTASEWYTARQNGNTYVESLEFESDEE
jgi:hypothetical protein